MLDCITYKEAYEWELFNANNPDQLDILSIQIAQIASFFANAFAPKKDKSLWNADIFIPKFEKEEKKKTAASISDTALSMAGIFGDTKTKKKIADHFEEGVVGSDGKRYKYALEETAPVRKTLPKRLRG